jgi:hypothetical protein
MTFPCRIDENVQEYYFDSFEALNELSTYIAGSECAEATFGDIESVIHEKGPEILRQLAQGHLNQRAAKEEKKEFITGEDGVRRTRRRKDCTRKIESRFGEVEASRIGYYGQFAGCVFPLDAELNLPVDKYSHGLQDEIAYLVAGDSFDETLDSLNRQGGGTLPKRQLQDVSANIAQDFKEFYALPLDPSPKDDTILVITADGKGVKMHNQDLRPATKKQAEASKDKPKKARLQPGEKNGKKRMATVVSVYETSSNQRTPEQIFSINGETTPIRPYINNKRVWAEITEDMGNALEQGFREALRRDPQQEMEWVVLIDGQTDLIRQVEAQAEKHNVEVTVIQDFIHVIEYLWKAAHALYPDKQNAEKREEWVRGRTLEILRGNAQSVASGLRRAASRRGLDEKERKAPDTAANYIEKNQERLKYDEALSKGLPIATGVIEGACRHLVKDRMDITGARWRLRSADAVLKLRALKSSGDMKKYMSFHFWKERCRNYFSLTNGAEIPAMI